MKRVALNTLELCFMIQMLPVKSKEIVSSSAMNVTSDMNLNASKRAILVVNAST